MENFELFKLNFLIIGHSNIIKIVRSKALDSFWEIKEYLRDRKYKNGRINQLIDKFSKKTNLQLNQLALISMRFQTKHIQNWLKQHLLLEKPVPPLLFFLIYLYSHLSPPDNYYPLLHLFALPFAFFCHFNFLFMLPAFRYVSNYPLALLLFATSLASCTRKWKLYLFLFSIADSYFLQVYTDSQFIGFASVFLCFSIYKNFIFQNKKQNRQYFTGFFVIVALQVVTLIQYSFSLSLQFVPMAGVGVISGLVGYVIITNRLQLLGNSLIETIKDARVVSQYLQLLKQELQVSSFTRAKIQIHARKCNKMSCFCRNNRYSHDVSYFARQVYDDVIRRFGTYPDQNLTQKYVNFLLQNQLVTNALYYLQGLTSRSYFAVLIRIKCSAKIEQYLNQQNSSNPFVKEYDYGLQYDHHCLKMSTQMYQILKKKMSFWKEVGKQTLSLKVLQQLGCQIVDKMYKLNKFYNQVINTYEKTLYSFDSTVLYAMYLISTTNFKDYAKGIIKNTAKLMEEVYVSQGNVSQTFAIRTVVKNIEKSFIKQKGGRFSAQTKLSTTLKLQQSYQNQFRLVIDAVSSGFCRLINVQKQNIIGQQLNSIIPNGYKQVHNIRLSYLLSFDKQELKEIVPSKVFHNQLKLSFKNPDNQLFPGLICIKYQVNIDEGLTFVSIIKKIPDRKSQALMDIDGKIMEMEKGFPENIVKHHEVKKYLDIIKKSWQRDQVIMQQKFNLMMDSENYEVTISSPLLVLFLQKQNLKNKNPPIHIQVQNEDNNKCKNFSTLGNNKADYQIKKMQKMLINYDQESSTSSSKGINSAVNVISNFSQNNSVPLYKYILVAFFAALFTNIAANLALNFLPTLAWDNTSPTRNPIADTLNLYLIQLMQSSIVLNLQDQRYFDLYQSEINISKVNAYFPPTYPTALQTLFQSIQQQWGTTLFAVFDTPSNLLTPAIKNRFDQQITIINPVINSYYNSSTINLYYDELLGIIDTDLNLANTKRNYSQLIINRIYQQVYPQLSSLSQVSSVLDASFNSSSNKQIIIGTTFGVFLALLLVPMCLVLRKRFALHEKVFDLLSSIDCEEVQKEIKSLLYISNILNNYQESQQKLKSNIRDYEQNMIKPKHSKGKRRPSVQNELVIGLSKFDVTKDEKRDEAEQVLIMSRSHIVHQQKQPKKSIFSAIKHYIFQQISHQGQLKKRKRSGQLDLTGSQYDQKQTINLKHCLIVVIISSFIALLIPCMIVNLAYINQTQQIKAIIPNAYAALINLNLKIFQAKVFLWQGGSAFTQQYNFTNQLSQLTSIVQNLLNYSIYGQNQSTPIPPGVAGSARASVYTASFQLLETELEECLKNLIEYRYNLQTSSLSNLKQSALWNSSMANIYEQIFYLQSLNNQIEQFVETMTNDMFYQMISHSQSFNSQKNFFLGCVIVWSVVSLVLGLFIINSMKKQFFKEVYILTFLNDEMVMKNKRVESYLENITKNSYM